MTVKMTNRMAREILHLRAEDIPTEDGLKSLIKETKSYLKYSLDQDGRASAEKELSALLYMLGAIQKGEQ